MNKLVKLRARPKLNSPNMLAAWPGIGNVSLIAATYLKRALNFKELGELEASYFFDPIGVVVKDNVVEAPQFPQSKFYYWKNAGKGSDILLFIGEDQPTTGVLFERPGLGQRLWIPSHFVQPSGCRVRLG